MRKLIPLAVLALAAWLGGMGRAQATLPVQKQAKAAGVEAANCMACHAEKLPKKGASTLNEKGKWLVEEKDKRKAKEVDGAWLKDYKEKK
jgi:mono/diheme cytochrome c family protein